MEDGLKQEDKPKTIDLAKLQRMFSEARDLTQDARTNSQTYTDYYDGIQLTEGEKLTLAKRGQPDIIVNRIRPAVNGMLGVVQKGKSEPKAWPKTPDKEPSADVATDSLRYIAEWNRWGQLKIPCLRDMLVPGTTAALITANKDLQIVIERIRWEEFFYDPRSRKEDFKDARYLGIAKWMYSDQAAKLYPAKAADLEASINAGPVGPFDNTFQDRPSDAPTMPWVDQKQRRLMIVEIYYQETGGEWWRCVFHVGGILEDSVSPYKNDKGEAACPIEAVSAYVDRENNRYGAVRDMMGPQDEINKRRSKALHYLNTRQVQESAPGQGMGEIDLVRSEAARPDGVLPSGWEVIPHTDQVSGQLELLQEAKGEIERLGPNPAILGRESSDSSGRALLARQQSGLVELAPLFGLFDDFELRVYRQCWARARQYWKAPQWIRVTDDEGAPQFIGLNQPQGAPVMDQTGQPAMDPQSGQPMEGDPQFHPETDPYTGQPHPQAGQSVFGYKNQIANLDVDLTLDTTQDVANIQQEQFQDLMQLVGSNPSYAQQVPFDIMLQLSSVPHKREITDKLKAYSQQAQQMQGQQMQAQMAKMQAELAEIQAKAAKWGAEAQRIGAEAQQGPQADPGAMAKSAADVRTANAKADQAEALAGQAWFELQQMTTNPREAEAKASQAEAQAMREHIGAASDLADLHVTKPLEAANLAAQTHQTLNPPQPSPGQG